MKNLGTNNGNAKLTDRKVRQIKLLLNQDELTQKQIADKFNVDISQISNINRGKYWSHVTLQDAEYIHMMELYKSSTDMFERDALMRAIYLMDIE